MEPIQWFCWELRRWKKTSLHQVSACLVEHSGTNPMILWPRKLCHRVLWETIQICLQKPTDTMEEIFAAFLHLKSGAIFCPSCESGAIDMPVAVEPWIVIICLSLELPLAWHHVTSIYEEFPPSSGDTILRRLRLWPTQQGRHWANQEKVSWQGLVLRCSATARIDLSKCHILPLGHIL